MSPENKALIERDESLSVRAARHNFDGPVAFLSTGVSMNTLNRLLDAAREEGRAEGERRRRELDLEITGLRRSYADARREITRLRRGAP